MKKYLILFFTLFILVSCGNKKIENNNISDKPSVQEVSQDKDLKEVTNFENEIENNKKGEETISEVELEKEVIDEDDNTNNIDKDNEKKSKKIYKKLSDYDLDTIGKSKDCLKLNLKRSDKIYCVKKVDSNLLAKATTLNDCKNIYLKSKKKKCLDKMYFILATDKKQKKYCNYIKDDSIKKTCISNLNNYFKQKELEEKRQKELEKKEQEQQQKKINSISLVSSCNSLNNNEKVICINKFVKQDKDLRYCNKLNGANKTKCINNNWNEVLKYNLLQAVKTKDKTYCDKIGNEQWIKRCYAGIK